MIRQTKVTTTTVLGTSPTLALWHIDSPAARHGPALLTRR